MTIDDWLRFSFLGLFVAIVVLASITLAIKKLNAK